MQNKYGRIVCVIIMISIFVSQAANLHSRATSIDSVSTENTYGEESFIAMDEEGNVTLIPLDELESFDMEVLELIDNIQYEIVLGVDSEESVVHIAETSLEVIETLETIQEIISENATVGAVAEELVRVMELEGKSVELDSQSEEIIERIVVESMSIQSEITDEETIQEEAITEEIITEEIITEETAQEEAITEEAITEEAITEEIITEEYIQEETAQEETTQEEITVDEDRAEVQIEEEVTEETTTENMAGGEEPVEETNTEELITEAIEEDTTVEEVKTQVTVEKEELAMKTLGFSTGSSAQASEKSLTVTTQKVTYDVEYGVVVFTASGVITYEDVNDGAYIPYVSKGMSPDAAYLGTASDGRIMFMQSGSVGLVDAANVSVIDYDKYLEQEKITSYYYTSQGKLYHAITTNLTSVASTQIVGYQQEYMNDNTNYYSYDSHYYYTSYRTMLSDYKNNTYKNAINYQEPYYNYYKYLSHRSLTEYTAEQIDEYIDYKIMYSNSDNLTSKSKLVNIGSILIENQNEYGVNAIMMLGVAINESAWGMSSYAQNRNNLFGHSAYDDDPDSADIYDTVAECVMHHAKDFVSTGFLDVATDSRYHGAHLGDKQSGMNVKYASDPYWGEKAAANAWLIEMYYAEDNIDAYAKTLGIVNNSASIYNEPGGEVLYEFKNYKMPTSWEMPLIVLESVEIDNTYWYKIRSDISIADDRNSVSCYLTYNFKDDYAYIKASEVYLAYDGGGVDDMPDSQEGDVMLGDANGDGKISSADYIAIKNHIMETSMIQEDNLTAADVNKDGKISSADYIAVKNHIMGDVLIQQ